MAEEAVAEADAFVRPLDQAGNVGQHEFAAIDADDAELRMQGCERIVADLRLGGRDDGQERRLAGVRQTDQPGVGDQLEPQHQSALLAELPRICATGRLVGRRS